MTTPDIDETIQLLRTLKLSQVRKQLEFDTENKRYFDDTAEEWYSRARIVADFFKAAKERF